MSPVPTDKRKGTYKKKLWNKIRDLIRSITDNLENYVEKYMKIKFNSDDGLPLKKTLELYHVVIVARSVFHEGNKDYPQAFLGEFFCKL